MQSPNRSRIAFLTLSMALVVPLLVSSLGTAAGKKSDEGDSLYKYLSVFTEVLRLVRSVYVEETDLGGLMAGALDGVTDALDPFSVYVPEDRIDAYRKTREVGNAHSGLLVLKERGVAYVVAVDEGSPGDEAGMEPGDILSEIEGVSSRAMPLWQIRGFLAGAPGAKVALEVIRQGNTEQVEIVLGPFQAPKVTLTQHEDVAVLRIPAIWGETVNDVDRILASVSAERLLIDLRGVAGGDPVAAYALAERFVSGELGSLRRGEDTVEVFESRGEPRFRGQVGLLVDRGAQGAAEVLVAVLGQQGAEVIGERTFGHAGQRSLVRLSSGGFLDLTDGFYTGPDGTPLAEGIEPDQELDVRRFGEEDEAGDSVLEDALELFRKDQPLDEEERRVA